MSGLTSVRQSPSSRTRGDEWSEYYALADREESQGPPRALLLAGLVVVGLGVLSWYYLGPDVKRYLKIQSM